MKYNPPALDSVDFELEEYTPPAPDLLEFELSAITVKVWDGSNWVEKPVKVWDGSEWIAPASIEYFDGSNFQEA
jgi:hypothetical protein